MGRQVGCFIKDLRYDRFWVIGFTYRDGKYVLCKKGKTIKFEILNKKKHDEAVTCSVIKFESKDKAKKQLTTVPPFDINGNDIFLEVWENSHHEFLFGI